MDPNTFTYNTQEAVSQALALARTFKNSEITPLHLFYALVLSSSGVIFEILEKTDINKKSLLSYLEKEIEKLPQVVGEYQQPTLSASLQKVFEKSYKIASEMGDLYLGREHIFLALLEDESIKNIADKFKFDIKQIREAVMLVRGNQKVTDQNPEAKYNVLKKYTIDFTELAKQGKLDPVIGRNNEIRRVMQVLSRRTKNNPVLLGDPGVGKTAIVEGLAQRIIAGDVPETLKNKQLLSLDLASILAGAKYRGEFEERLKAIIAEIEKNPDRYLLFMDELHTLVGAGAAEGAIDASNMLKPALARGNLHAIGATTVSEYRKYIEKDAALERRFQPVYIDEPSVEDTIAILRGLKEKYEAHHGIRISDEALIAAVTLSHRYITDRFLPDKAIDLVDEAAAGIKIESESMPLELDELKRKVTQIEIELAALKKEKGGEAEKTKKELQKKIAEFREREKELTLIWKNQKEIIQSLQQKRAELDKLKANLETAEREVQLEKAAEIKYGIVPQVEKEIKNFEKKWQEIPEEKKLLRQEVTDEDIARVVARWTGIPVTRLLKTEGEKLINLEAQLRKSVVGQDKALNVIAKAIRRNRAGLSPATRPIGVFLFLGPTGVGKTETAKALAEAIFDSREALIRVDMSEYQEPHTVARLIGAPPGYIGFEEGGQLTEAVRKKPYSAILFDEIEKANPVVFNLFLQIFDDGRLTDGRGKTVDFRNTIIIMTSNLGTSIIAQYEDNPSVLQAKTWELLRSKFPPEFLNRIDQIVIYKSLDKKLMTKIVELQLSQLSKSLEEKKIKISFTKPVIEYLAQAGFDKTYGARPLKRLITEKIEDCLATQLIENKLKEGDSITLDYQKDKIVIK